MDKFWIKALSVAGISAIGFFIFVSLYNNWLKLPIFSKLSETQTFIIMLVFLVLVFLALISALIVHTKQNPDEKEWMLYQVAFLWHGVTPPSIKAHFSKMTPEIKETKDMLHEAINAGQLKVIREIQTTNGLTRWVTKSELKRYARLINQSPKFLK